MLQADGGRHGLRYESGQPISFCCATPIPGWDNSIYYRRDPTQSLASASYRAGKLNPFVPGENAFFNSAAFIDPNSTANRGTGAYTFGNIRRVTGEVRSQHYDDEDISIMKTNADPRRHNFCVQSRIDESVQSPHVHNPGHKSDGLFFRRAERNHYQPKKYTVHRSRELLIQLRWKVMTGGYSRLSWALSDLQELDHSALSRWGSIDLIPSLRSKEEIIEDKHPRQIGCKAHPAFYVALFGGARGSLRVVSNDGIRIGACG